MAEWKRHAGHFIRVPFADRFWAKVGRVYLPSGELDYSACWDWLGKHTTGTQDETGEIRLPAPSKRFIKAPRAALILAEGIPEELLAEANTRMAGWDAAHTVCDRPPCCNPTHLSWQTHRQNMYDYIEKFGGVARRKSRCAAVTPLLDPLDPPDLPGETS